MYDVDSYVCRQATDRRSWHYFVISHTSLSKNHEDQHSHRRIFPSGLATGCCIRLPPVGQNDLPRSSTTSLEMGNPIDGEYNLNLCRLYQGYVSTNAHLYTNAYQMHTGLFSFLKEGKVGLVKSLAGDYDSAAVRSKIDNLISDNDVLMFSFTTCPFCIKAKATLDEKGAKYTVLELDQIPDGKAIRAEMGDMLGRTSVPAIWIKGTFIGGCNDGPMGGINTLNSNNQLDDMLKAAGAI
eukprot:scaffold7559_cov137-Skeletonema_menzelii.AAC.11